MCGALCDLFAAPPIAPPGALGVPGVWVVYARCVCVCVWVGGWVLGVGAAAGLPQKSAMTVRCHTEGAR